MSFPDHTIPQSYTSPPFACDAGGFWPPYFVENIQPDLASQYDRGPPFKRQRNSENKPPINQTNGTGSNGTSHIFYKTRICAKFMDGMCRNGEQCTFAHGPEDLRVPPPNWQELVREKDRGAGNNWNDDQRVINRTKICKKYYNGGDCPYGEMCIFLHERAPNSSIEVPWQRESSAISIGTRRDAMWSSTDFNQADSSKQVTGGFDTYQARMSFWKTKICSKWEIGHCPYGERCYYAHGQSDLKVSGSRLESEQITNSSSIPANSIAAPANPVIGSPLREAGEDKKSSKWKLSKKINRIYADWLDDLSPPHCSPNKKDDI